MESQEDWSPAAATAAFLGMGIAFVLWWWYFDGVSGASEQPVRTRREAIRFHVWSYAHFPLYLGIIVAGVGVERVVTAAARAALATADATILTGAIATVMVAMTVIDITSFDRRPNGSIRVLQHLMLVAATVTLGIAWHIESPVVLIVTIAALCVTQLVVSLARASSARQVVHATPHPTPIVLLRDPETSLPD